MHLVGGQIGRRRASNALALILFGSAFVVACSNGLSEWSADGPDGQLIVSVREFREDSPVQDCFLDGKRILELSVPLLRPSLFITESDWIDEFGSAPAATPLGRMDDVGWERNDGGRLLLVEDLADTVEVIERFLRTGAGEQAARTADAAFVDLAIDLEDGSIERWIRAPVLCA